MIFILYLSSLQMRRGGAGYPFDTEVLRAFQSLRLQKPITMLCGENGCGKTTLLEILAQKACAARIGQSTSLTPAQSAVRKALPSFSVTWQRRPQHHFHFSADRFAQYIDYVVEEKRSARDELDSLPGRYGSEYADTLAAQPYAATLGALEGMYETPLECQSHGQGFFEFFRSRVLPGGLYFCDEPEAALSCDRLLALCYLLRQAVQEDCQFVLATHSPILLACPDADLIEIRNGVLCPTKYDGVSSVDFLKRFLFRHDDYFRDME